MPQIFSLEQVYKETPQAPSSILLYPGMLPDFVILHITNGKAAAYRHTIHRISITIQLQFPRVFYSGN